MSRSTESPEFWPLLKVLVPFLVVGGPMALFIWRELSELLMGRVHPGPVAIALVLLVVLAGLSRWVGRRLLRYGGEV